MPVTSNRCCCLLYMLLGTGLQELCRLAATSSMQACPPKISGVSDCSVVATICIQANVSIEEVLTWKMFDMNPANPHYVIFKQEASRVGPKRDVILPRLPNMLICPLGLISMMSVARVSEASLMGSIRNRQAANVYLIHDPDSLVKPLTPNNIKKQLIKGLAKININVLPYEVQPLLSATYVKCGMNASSIKVRSVRDLKLSVTVSCARHVDVPYFYHMYSLCQPMSIFTLWMCHVHFSGIMNVCLNLKIWW